jgi:hypothetical protein
MAANEIRRKMAPLEISDHQIEVRLSQTRALFRLALKTGSLRGGCAWSSRSQSKLRGTITSEVGAEVAGAGRSLREDFLDLYRRQTQVGVQYLHNWCAKVGGHCQIAFLV